MRIINSHMQNKPFFYCIWIRINLYLEVQVLDPRWSLFLSLSVLRKYICYYLFFYFQYVRVYWSGLTVKQTWHPDPQLHWHFGLLIHNHPGPEFLVLGTLKSDSQSYITSSLLLNLILSVLLYLSTSFIHPRLNDQLLLLFISMFLLWLGEQNIL